MIADASKNCCRALIHHCQIVKRLRLQSARHDVIRRRLCYAVEVVTRHALMKSFLRQLHLKARSVASLKFSALPGLRASFSSACKIGDGVCGQPHAAQSLRSSASRTVINLAAET